MTKRVLLAGLLGGIAMFFLDVTGAHGSAARRRRHQRDSERTGSAERHAGIARRWYGFPATYMTTGVVGFICLGLVAAAVMKEQVPATMAAAA